MNRLFALIICMGLAFFAGQSSEIEPIRFGSPEVATTKESLENIVKLVNLALDSAEKEHIKKEVPKPTPGPIVDICRCNGSKVIVHGDGHSTPCQCSDRPGGCICVRLSPPLPKDTDKPEKVVEKVVEPIKAKPAPTPQMMPPMPVVPTIETIFQGIPQ